MKFAIAPPLPFCANGAGAGGPTDGPVVRQRAMADGEDRVAKASDVRDGAADARAEAARDAVVEPADGLIVVEHTVADGEGASGILDGAADAGAGWRRCRPHRRWPGCRGTCCS